MNYKFCVFIENKLRVDIYLCSIFEDFSRSYIQKIIDNGQLKLNSKILKKNTKISNKDEIELKIITYWLEEVKAEKMDLDIVFEDDNILVINKDSNINVHPVPGSEWKKSTLVNGILEYCKENLPVINWVERPWIVHRLDKDTTGIIMIAKNDKMMSYLSNTIKNREVWKYYLTIVSGIFKQDKFKIESYIGRDPNNRKKMTTKNPSNPKLAITYWKTLNYINNNYSLLMIKLETWRTHQIRVHLASIGYPIIWDKIYWNAKVNKEVYSSYWLKRQALHAYFLEIDLYKKPMKFVAPIKDDMKKIIKQQIDSIF